MLQLIINADDFGYCTGVNKGIISAFKKGALSSTTLMANSVAFDEAVHLAKSHPKLGVGCHLCLTGGCSVSAPSKIPTLIDKNSNFYPDLNSFLRALVKKKISKKDIETELRAQIEKILAAGIEPTHVDSHKHIYVLPVVASIIMKLCKEYGISAIRTPFDSDPYKYKLSSNRRIGFTKQWVMGRLCLIFKKKWMSLIKKYNLKSVNKFFGVAYTGSWTEHYLEKVIEMIPKNGIAELMVHPGIMDESLKKSPTRLKESRENELNILTKLIPRVTSHGKLMLVSYAIFAQKKGL